MNCKFHTDKESVTKCAVCGADWSCYFFTNFNGEGIC